MEPLRVAFLWHQHQPYYKHPEKEFFILPWVRLHALKDYYDLAALLEEFSDIRQNFNLVPSLLLQIQDYLNGARDYVQILSEKPAAELTAEEKADILHYFFQVNWDRLVKPYPDYERLLKKRGLKFDPKHPEAALRRFSVQDFLDLQVWYNLCWIGESHKGQKPFSRLLKKGKNFTEAEKKELLESQRSILEKIIPLHKKLAQNGQIELSTTPFYHPILPLLCDTTIARMSQGNIQLPRYRFRYPEDAEEQIVRALHYFEKTFGFLPAGMWPAEGSVSEEAIELFARKGIRWIATDEEILFASWGLMGIREKMTREDLYRPYAYRTESGEEIVLFFRDHVLSDLIGFVYQRWDPEEAAEDFVKRLRSIRASIVQRYGEKRLRHSLVSVILDGENCWEFYVQNGRPFLEALYRKLSGATDLACTTFSDFLKNQYEPEYLTRIFAGSWINHNFSIWIGHPEDNRAWEYLYETRLAWQKAKEEGRVSPEALDAAYEEILIAEGSDWCWWYGEEHPTENAAEFDTLFRSHLIRAFELIEQEPPRKFFDPIRTEVRKRVAIQKPIGFIDPVIDGRESNYFEWLGAGSLDARRVGTAMHAASQAVESIQYGFNLEEFFLKIVFSKEIRQAVDEVEIELHFLSPAELKMRLPVAKLHHCQVCEEVLIWKRGKWVRESDGIRAAYDRFLEFSIPFKRLRAKVGQKVEFLIRVRRAGNVIETWPPDLAFEFEVPGEDFEQIEWKV